MLHRHFKEDIELSNYIEGETFCYCERDGYILYLVNSGLSAIDIKELMKNVS